MVMTTKVDFKKVLIALIAAAAVILAIVLMTGKKEEKPETGSSATEAMSTNDTRVAYLADLGWEVTTSPKETSQVRIPDTPTEVYDRYNALQKSQGYDLTRYSGKTVMRYVYEVKNFPGATDPVYATLLVYKDNIIGGDITDTSPKGAVQGLRKAGNIQLETTPSTESTVPGTSSDT